MDPDPPPRGDPRLDPADPDPQPLPKGRLIRAVAWLVLLAVAAVTLALLALGLVGPALRP